MTTVERLKEIMTKSTMVKVEHAYMQAAFDTEL